jgi:hypothetical protein
MTTAIRPAGCALIAALVAASGAQAADLYCSITNDKSGAKTAYVFRSAGDDVFAEIAVGRDGWVKEHQPKDRPLWSTRLYKGMFTITYRADRRYRLIMPNETKSDGNGFMWTPAVLFRDMTIIANGRCRYKREPTHGFEEEDN